MMCVCMCVDFFSSVMIILVVNINFIDLCYNLCLYCLYLILTLWGPVRVYVDNYSS